MSVMYNYERRGLPHPKPRYTTSYIESSSDTLNNYNSDSQTRGDGHRINSGYSSSSGFHETPLYSPTNTSQRQYLDVQRLPLNDSDSSVLRPMPRTASTISSDADVESLASGQTQSSYWSSADSISTYDPVRYNDELYKPRPVAAPRNIRKMFGEKHPRLLKPEELPAADTSADETDTSSVNSLSTPTPRPRASSRAKRIITFIEEEAIREENKHLKSILKSLGERSSSKVVRFEHVDKSRVRRVDAIDYSDVDSNHGCQTKKSTDIWGHVKPVKVEKKRNDRGRSPSRNSHHRRQRSGSRTSQSSISKSNSTNRTRVTKPEAKERVEIQVSQNGTNNSMVRDIQTSDCCSDRQKVCKWLLIIGIPTVVLVIVIIVVVVSFAGSDS